MKKAIRKYICFIIGIVCISSVILATGILAYLTDSDSKNNFFIFEDEDENNPPDDNENNNSGSPIIENGKISNADPGEYLTSYFSENINMGDVIRYTTRVDDVTYGPYSFLYTEEEQVVIINAHTELTCTIYNDRITLNRYSGDWKDIYFDMDVDSLPTESIVENGKISDGAAEEYLTANFSKNVTIGSYIRYTTMVDGETYGPFYIRYENIGQTVTIEAHRGITCEIFDDRITATHYPGAWKDIYISMAEGMPPLEKIVENAKISDGAAEEYATANFSKNITIGNYIKYTTTVDGETYGPYIFQYQKEGQSITINAHTGISCYIYSDRIEVNGYSGAWKDIYIDVEKLEY